MSATESGVQSAVLCDAAMGDTMISTVWVGLWQAVIHMHVQCEVVHSVSVGARSIGRKCYAMQHSALLLHQQGAGSELTPLSAAQDSLTVHPASRWNCSCAFMRCMVEESGHRQSCAGLGARARDGLAMDAW